MACFITEKMNAEAGDSKVKNGPGGLFTFPRESGMRES